MSSGLSGCGDAGSGEDLYAMACAACHGKDRTGVEGLGPDLSAGSFALEESDQWLADRIRHGFDAMPGFDRSLSEAQVGLIVAYLRDEGPEPATTSTAAPLVIAPTSRPSTTGASSSTAQGATGPTTSTSGALPPTTTRSPPTPTVAPAITTASDVGGGGLAVGRRIYDVEAGGVGCASCHGFDAQGTSGGPNIIGVSKSAISGALGGGVREMEEVRLTPDELDAVYQYLRFLTQQR